MPKYDIVREVVEYITVEAKDGYEADVVAEESDPGEWTRDVKSFEVSRTDGTPMEDDE